MLIIKVLRVLILILVLWNIPAYLLYYFSPSLGSLSSYLTSALLIGYYILDNRREGIANPFILVGLLFYIFSSFNYDIVDVDNYFLKEFLRFMIVVTCGTVVARRTNFKEIYTILGIGSLSIIINAFFYPEASVVMGRAAGFYINANAAGAICVLGYGVSYSINDRKMRLIGQLLFTFAGIITFSRTFLVIWAIITLFSIIRNKRNILVPVIGVLAFILLFSFAEELTLSKERFSAIQSIVDGGNNKNVKVLQEDSRQDTWAKYYDMIFDKPFFGHGFTMFQRKTNGMPGVHNTYLMVLGEAGIVPFLLFIYVYTKLLVKSWDKFKEKPYLFNITLILVIYMMTGHTYFQNFYMVLLSMFVFESLKLKIQSDTKLKKL